jgi:PAS domain S-box-containing protein
VPDETGSASSGSAFPATTGELASLIRQFDWTKTSLGRLEAWPQSLKTVAETLLRSPVPIVLLWGEDGIMIYNDAYSVFAGGRHPQLLGSKVREGWPEVADFNDHVMKVGLAGGTLAYSDQELTLFRHGRPEQVWMNLDYSPVLNEQGEPAGVIAIVVETTQRVMAERRVRESEERFRAIANSAPIPIWVTQLDGDRLFVNQAYLEFFGLELEQALTFDWRRSVHPEDAARVLSPEQLPGLVGKQSERATNPFALELRIRRADGKWRWMRSVSQPRLDADGRHVGFIGVAHDITVAKQAELELRRANEGLERRIQERTSQLEARETQMRAILETSNQHHCLIDLGGGLLYANGIALAAIDAAATEVLRQPFWETPWFIDTPGASAVVRETFASALNGEIAHTELLLHLKGSKRLFDFAMRPIADRSGAVTGVVSDAVDITDRRRNEEELRQSQKMDAVGQLTGGVAHDFNNLLTVIRSATDLLRRPDLPTERRERYINAISDTIDRASKLTSQLLAFARRQPLRPETFNISKQIESIAQLLMPALGNRIQIGLQLPDEDCFALADVAQFETAVINLALNARDAMPNGGAVTLRVAEAEMIPSLLRPGKFVAVSVIDSGSGISPDKREKIFEPFYTTKESGRGTGLGLSQVFGFVKQSGGEVEVISDLGKGASFTLYLPSAEAPDTGKAAVSTVPEARRHDRGLRVLLVEDNEDIGNLATEQLRDLGYRASWARSAEDALGCLAADGFAFDLMFSDIVMPGMNGIELANTVRERYPHLAIVLTTGYSDALAESARSGFALIRKPYSIEALARTLPAVIEGTSARLA